MKHHDRRITLTLCGSIITVVALLTMTGCGPLSVLNDIVVASEAALPVIEAAGVQVPPQVPTYLSDVTGCIAAQGNVSNPTTQQLLAISACFAGLVTPTLTGLPASVVEIVSLVIKDVANYLAAQVPPKHRNATLNATQFSQLCIRAQQVQVKARRAAQGLIQQHK